MFNLRNVPVTTMVAGGGAAAVGLPFASMLITHPLAGGIYLLLGATLVAKVQQHATDKREAKRAVAEATARAAIEREQEQERETRITGVIRDARASLPQSTPVVNPFAIGQAERKEA